MVEEEEGDCRAAWRPGWSSSLKSFLYQRSCTSPRVLVVCGVGEGDDEDDEDLGG
jgi:hypothetical protein